MKTNAWRLLVAGLLLLPAPVLFVDKDLARDVTIHRDQWGIPHVLGKSDAATAFGFGYAQAEDNWPRIEDNFLRSVGRSAEWLGEDGVAADRINRALGIPQLARAEYTRMQRPMKSLLDGYAAGINHWLAKHPDPTRRLARVEPWHTLAYIRYNYYQNGFFFGSGLRREEVKLAARSVEEEASNGSNGWVISPSKSATGHAMLFINPHLPFFGTGQVYEGHVQSASGWQMTGYTRLGFPLPYVGHNGAVGWVSTDNQADLSDLYVETFDDPARPLAYRYGNGYRLATEWTDTILVKTASGMERRALTLRKTHHGPLVGERDGRPLAVRMARFEESGWVEEWYAMSRARTVGELRKALEPRAMLFGNVMAADTAGNTFYIYNGAVPRRDPRFNWRRPVEGSDTTTEWRGYHTLDELPQLTNPASGWMQNCNTTPFLLTDVGNPDPSKYPAYMVTEGDNPRGQVSREILAGQPQLNWEAWQALAFDTRVGRADSMLPLLFADGEKYPGSKARSDALAELARWNRRADTLSIGTSLFMTWLTLVGELEEDRPGHPENRVAALDTTIDGLSSSFGSWRVEWGKLNRLQRTNDLSGRVTFSDSGRSVAVPGVNGGGGAVFTYYTGAQRGTRARYGTAGATYVSVVEFGPKVRARAVHVMGASGDPKSPHYFDQAPLYARGEMRPVWFTSEEVKANSSPGYHPGMER